MAKCKRCGNHGLFLKTDAFGLCADCVRASLSEELNKSQKGTAEVQREYEQTLRQYNELNAMVTPEMLDADALSKRIEQLHAQLKEVTEAVDVANGQLKALQDQILVAEDVIELESYALYRPTYNFTTSEEYKNRLDEVRQKQKEMIRDKNAAKCSKEVRIVNSKNGGWHLQSDNMKMALRVFNVECDNAVRDVKFNNFDRCVLKIDKSFEQTNKLGSLLGVYISDDYRSLKLRELSLAYEYALKKQQEKEEQAEIRRQQREQAKLEKEIAEARKAAEKEKQHFEQALSAIDAQINVCIDAERKSELEKRRQEIRDGLDGIETKLEDIDYRQSNQRAGYVYIISNIGAFGENVYKIGMTRRLNPMERVDELGDASVPFYFDVHAMIFSEDAPALEATLHHAFEDRRLNKVNRRREYFRVTLDEIKEVVRANYNKSVEFVDFPTAEQYRESLKMD